MTETISQEKQQLLMPGLLPPVTVKIGSQDPIVMTKERMQQALMYGEIPKKTYIKWALLQEYGKTTNANVDFDKIQGEWSILPVYNPRKDKLFELILTKSDIFLAIAALEKSGDLFLVDQPIQLKLNLYPDMGA